MGTPDLTMLIRVLNEAVATATFQCAGMRFVVESGGEGDCPKGDDRFHLYKSTGLLRQYEAMWSRFVGARYDRIIELGTWDGGSTVLWSEFFRPTKLVALDESSRGDSDYFREYIETYHLQERIRTCWGLDQADRDTVLEIADTEFDGELDLVIDDASHQYEETKASFEVLFPLLRPKGLYVIEDWAWGLWVHPSSADEFLVKAETARDLSCSDYMGRVPLHKFVIDLLGLVGGTWLVRSLTVMQGLVVVERGGPSLTKHAQAFALDNFDCVRAVPSGSLERSNT